MHPRYQSWLRYAFDHPVADPEWHHDLDAPTFDADENTIAQLIDCTFRNAGQDLARFSDAQVNQGLWYRLHPVNGYPNPHDKNTT